MTQSSFMTLSQLVGECAKELGINVESSGILSSSNVDTRQLGALIISAAKDARLHKPYSVILGNNPWVLNESQDGKYEVMGDGDTILMDARMLVHGAKWRWLNSKGLRYAEEYMLEQRVKNSIAFQAFAVRARDGL